MRELEEARERLAVLGLCPGATLAEIEQAHRKLIVAAHPDLVHEPAAKAAAEREATALNEARAWLRENLASLQLLGEEVARENRSRRFTCPSCGEKYELAEPATITVRSEQCRGCGKDLDVYRGRDGQVIAEASVRKLGGSGTASGACESSDGWEFNEWTGEVAGDGDALTNDAGEENHSPSESDSYAAEEPPDDDDHGEVGDDLEIEEDEDEAEDSEESEQEEDECDADESDDGDVEEDGDAAASSGENDAPPRDAGREDARWSPSVEWRHSGLDAELPRWVSVPLEAIFWGACLASGVALVRAVELRTPDEGALVVATGVMAVQASVLGAWLFFERRRLLGGVYVVLCRCGGKVEAGRWCRACGDEMHRLWWPVLARPAGTLRRIIHRGIGAYLALCLGLLGPYALRAWMELTR